MVNPLEFIKRFKGLLYDATIGLVKNYQDKAIHIAKLQAATFYLQSIQVIRKQCIILCSILFCLAIAAVGIVVVPVAFVLAVPMSVGTKAALLAVLGITYIAVPLVMMNRYMSEERWLEFTKSKELIEELTNN